MKSVLGLLGLSLLIFSCGGNGQAVFDPLAGSNQGASSGNGASGNGAGTSSGAGGKANTGGSSSGTGGGTSGTSNTGGEPDGGDGPGPILPGVVYVATGGTDDAQCGLTKETACKSISQGVTRAVEAERGEVDVQAGTYPGIVVLKPGVQVIGGFNTNWESGARTDDAYKVLIQGAAEATTGEFLAVWAHDLSTQASLQNLLIAAPAATGQKPGSLDGRSSYGVHAVNAKLKLKDVDITAAAGADGLAGDDGQDAMALLATDAMNGKIATDGSSGFNFCGAEGTAGGQPGSNTCASSPSATLMSGGKGGGGGASDTKCSSGTNWTALPGDVGGDAPAFVGQSGKGGSFGTGGDGCSAPGPGQPGAISNGAGGKAMSGGYVAADFWYGLAGGDGATGNNGGGGGGGGGAGGCDFNDSGLNDARGASGGGGGAGGCAARAGGKGGGGGGGSFGIYAVNSQIDSDAVSIARGMGGAGGDGGDGGQGQSGGLGHVGGTAYYQAAGGAKGGSGAHGGHGGGGAGGSGGRSLGVVLAQSSTVTGTLSVTGGAAGGGGPGGASAPNAPQAEKDGVAGETGVAGSIGETLDCGANASC